MYDIILRHGSIVDGSGGDLYQGDVAIGGGKILAIGKVEGPAHRYIDVDGLVVAPGAIDIHTHYDAQVCWDGALLNSVEHGTTTVIQGNCGIGVSPCRPSDREDVLNDLVVLEGIAYEVMVAGIDWKFETFPEYLSMLRSRGLGLNVAALVPLGPLRRYVMGDSASERAASEQECMSIANLLGHAVQSGAYGFSSTMVRRQVGYKGRALPCQLASREELAAYSRMLRKCGRGIIQVNVVDSPGYLTDEAYSTIVLLLDEGGRPVTFSGALDRQDNPEAIEAMLRKAAPLRERGAMPQTMVRPMVAEADLRSPLFFADVPSFKRILNRPLNEQKAIYRDSEWRKKASAELNAGGNVFGDSWKKSLLFRCTDESLRPLLMKSVTEIAIERRTTALDAMLDIALQDELRSKFLQPLWNTDPGRLSNLISDPRVLIGLADSGAHLDTIFESNFPTYMLGHWVRNQKAIKLEKAIQRMTSEPAKFFQMTDRGMLALGKFADIMVFDPVTVNAPQLPTEIRDDLPGGGVRLYSKSEGMEFVLVNGKTVIEHGLCTDARPGALV